MRGGKPVPTHLKIIRGNPGKRPLPKNEPQPEAGADMPDWLSPEAAKHWPKVAKQLDDAGVLTQMDAPALALYCEAFARWKHANEQVAKFGPVIKSASGFPKQSPFLTISNESWKHMMKVLVEFGMTPSSRTRVAVAKPKVHESPLDKFKRPAA